MTVGDAKIGKNTAFWKLFVFLTFKKLASQKTEHAKEI